MKFVTKSALSMCHLSRLLTDSTLRVACLLLSLLFLFRAVGDGYTPKRGCNLHQSSRVRQLNDFLRAVKLSIYVFNFYTCFSFFFISQPARFMQIDSQLSLVYRSFYI